MWAMVCPGPGSRSTGRSVHVVTVSDTCPVVKQSRLPDIRPQALAAKEAGVGNASTQSPGIFLCLKVCTKKK